MAKYVPIVPNATTADEDMAEYRAAHLMLFGHLPIPDLRTGKRCGHPLHDGMQRLMDAPGVHVEIPYDPHEVISDDDERVVAFERGYQERVQQFKDQIAMLESRAVWERKR